MSANVNYSAAGTATKFNSQPYGADGTTLTDMLDPTSGATAALTADLGYDQSISLDANFYQEFQGLIGYMCSTVSALGSTAIPLTPRAALMRVIQMAQSMLQQQTGTGS